MTDDKISHIGDRRRPTKSSADPDEQLVQKVADAVDLRVAKHFQQQNEILVNGIQRLIEEVDGVRTGRADQAFAKVAPVNCDADLPTIQADISVHYPHSAKEIGELLGLTAHEVGTLLGPLGMDWAGNPAYQEMGRYKPGRQKFWHHTVPDLLREALSNPPTSRIGNANKRIKAIVRKWRAANCLAEVVPHPGLG